MPGKRHNAGDSSKSKSAAVVSSTPYSVQSAALGVVLDNLFTLFFPRAVLRASDLARLAAVDTRCRDAVRAAVEKRRLGLLPSWISKPWPELFCTHPFARLTPACKAETSLEQTMVTVHPTTLMANRVYEVYAAEMLTLDIEDPEGLLTQPAKGRLTFSAITVPASDTHFFNRSKKKGKTTPTDPKNSEQVERYVLQCDVQGLSLFHDDLSRAGADAEMELRWQSVEDNFIKAYVSDDDADGDDWDEQGGWDDGDSDGDEDDEDDTGLVTVEDGHRKEDDTDDAPLPPVPNRTEPRSLSCVGQFQPTTTQTLGSDYEIASFWATFGLSDSGAATTGESPWGFAPTPISVREFARSVALKPWIPDRTEFLDADSLDDEQAGVGELATEIKADGNCSSHDPMLRGFVDQSRNALWVEKGDLHIYLPCSAGFEIALLARPVVLPKKDAKTVATEAVEEESARTVVKVKADLAEAKDKARMWAERVEKLTTRLVQAEAGTLTTTEEDDIDDECELDLLLNRQVGRGYGHFDDIGSESDSDSESESESE